jgi:hypothetical protein
MVKKTFLVEKKNSDFFLRPRFSIVLKENYDVVIQRFFDEFKSDENAFRGTIVDGHIFISVPKKDEYFWSPQLHLEVVEIDKNLSTIKGLFGPKPQVWTLFMFIHFIIGISFLGFAVLLYAKISLKEPIFFPLVMIFALPFIWIVLYFLGKTGKNTGKNKMKKLHDFIIKLI